MMLDGAEECQLSGPIGELVPFSSRCQRSRVSGVTRKQRQRHLGSTRLSAASIARSAVR